MKKRKLIILISTVLTLILSIGAIYYFAIKLPDIKKKEEQIKQFNEYYEAKLDMYAAENLLYDEFEVDVAFLGDSLTDGYDVKSYYSEYLVTNRGIGGDTTYGLF